jgi:transcriptional regulator with XRE-family HTH domain
MNIGTLVTLMRARGLNQTDVARLAGVSRQAVSLWFRKRGSDVGTINLHSRTQTALARALGVPVDALTRHPPSLPPDATRQVESEVLWDCFYPSLTEFAAALVRGELPALARLVQAYGLFRAARIAGKRVWKKFPDYKRYIEPRQREEWSRIWALQKNLGLI